MFGQWVRTQREALRLDQVECARRAGIQPQQWNRIEKRLQNPSSKTLAYVAAGLDLTLETVWSAVQEYDREPNPSAEVQRMINRLTPEQTKGALHILRAYIETCQPA